MTGRNTHLEITRDQGHSAVRRVVLPLLVFASTIVAAGCFQQATVGEAGTSRNAAPAVVAGQPRSAGLAQDDPLLSMSALGGTPTTAVLASSVRVLPDGNVQATPLDVAPGAVVSTTITRWVKTTVATTLWSGSNTDAAAFTDLPQGSLFRAVGPDANGRSPVYYVGDGMLRRAGNGWVDARLIETVEAPAPGQVPAVDADASQPMPIWVQAHRATKLWSGPDDKAVTLTDLPQWTFLKVDGLERGGRILVNYAGDYASRQPGIGWVDSTSVGPAGDPGRWVTNHRATTIWSGTDDRAMRFSELPQWTKLRIVDGAVDAARMQVEFFGDGVTRAPGTAWIARADVGPITPPVPLPAVTAVTAAQAASATTLESRTFASGNDFINAVGEAAQRSYKSSGVPASVTVAQAILESDWGRSRLSRQGNNLFGIKALGSASGPAGVVTLATWEHLAGGDVVVQAPFKAYFTLEQSIDDHGTFFTRNRRYAAALAMAGDARAFASAIQDAGYATDPSYASKLISLMDRYNLYRFDG
ncbi:MAG TPA: glycoside hydrolase family 73 protein [Chloroflexota bacterium]|nr:glycoside hydrolase family 73 protein [Chloroflexota bacterium]